MQRVLGYLAVFFLVWVGAAHAQFSIQPGFGLQQDEKASSAPDQNFLVVPKRYYHELFSDQVETQAFLDFVVNAENIPVDVGFSVYVDAENGQEDHTQLLLPFNAFEDEFAIKAVAIHPGYKLFFPGSQTTFRLRIPLIRRHVAERNGALYFSLSMGREMPHFDSQVIFKIIPRHVKIEKAFLPYQRDPMIRLKVVSNLSFDLATHQEVFPIRWEFAQSFPMELRDGIYYFLFRIKPHFAFSFPETYLNEEFSHQVVQYEEKNSEAFYEAVNQYLVTGFFPEPPLKPESISTASTTVMSTSTTTTTLFNPFDDLEMSQPMGADSVVWVIDSQSTNYAKDVANVIKNKGFDNAVYRGKIRKTYRRAYLYYNPNNRSRDIEDEIEKQFGYRLTRRPGSASQFPQIRNLWKNPIDYLLVLPPQNRLIRLKAIK